MKLRLTKITYGAKDTNLYEFSSLDGSTLPKAEPGAHIGLHLPNGMLRQYSLVNNDDAPTHYVVGVKRDPKSRGGSKFIHESLIVGTELDVDEPKNHFPLAEKAPHSILIGGGIGVTPIYNMMTYLKAKGASYDFYYACRAREDAIFLNDLQKEPNVHFHFDVEAGHVFDMKALVDSAPAGSHFYCCGPGPMLGAYEEATAELPSEQVHLEYFSAAPVAAASTGGYTVVLAKSGQAVPVEEGQTILQALLAVGIDVPYSCETGVCGACETKVLEGTPDHHDMILTEEEKARNDTMMVCCSGSKTDHLVLDL